MTALDGWLRRMTDRKPALLLAVLTVVLLAVNAPDQSYMAHDEGYYAQQARVALATGDWITQHWFDDITYDRAMGNIWLIAASQSLFGFSEMANRLPAMLASFGAVLLTYAIGKRFASQQVAFAGAAILAVTPIWMQASKLATQDIPLAFVALLAVWSLLRAEDGSSKIAWGILAGAAFSAGFVIKSFMIVPIVAALAPYILWEHRRHRHLLNPGLYLGAAIGILPTVLWLGLSFRMYGWAPITIQIEKLLFLAGEDFHSAGPLYYFWNIPLTAFPWPFFALAGGVIAWRAPSFRRKSLFIGFPVLLLVELTMFSTRTWYYALQLLPYLSLLAAVALVALAQRYRQSLTGQAVIMAMAAAALGTLLIVAAVIVGLRPSLIGPEWFHYVIMGATAGLALLAPLAVIQADRRKGSRSPSLFSASFLAGPFMAIALLFATGLWGDYGARIKQPLSASPLSTVLTSDSHDVFIVTNYPGGAAGADVVLLALYTNRPTRKVSDTAGLPERTLVWVHSDGLPALTRPYEQIGIADNWHLLRLNENS